MSQSSVKLTLSMSVLSEHALRARIEDAAYMEVNTSVWEEVEIHLWTAMYARVQRRLIWSLAAGPG